MQLTTKKSWSNVSQEGSEFNNFKDWWNAHDSAVRPWNRFYLQGAMTVPVRTVTSAYTLGDLDYVLLVNASSQVIATLPDASVSLGRSYIVMETGAGSVKISTTNSQTINGGPYLLIPGKWFASTLFSDGSNWIAI